MKVYLRALSAFSPRAPDWSSMAAVLRAEQVPAPEPVTEKYQPVRLPRNERRRATDMVRLTFRVLEELVQAEHIETDALNAVFASSGGDYDVVHRISQALATPEKQISPTDFHNSVHNAPAGYWSIATGCHAPSTSLSAGDDTFVTGLLEAVMLCLSEAQDTLLVAYDIAPPLPLRSARPIEQPFAVAMLIGASTGLDDLASLELTPEVGAEMSNDLQALKQQLAQGNPIGRCLPLLSALAHQQTEAVLPGLRVRLAY